MAKGTLLSLVWLNKYLLISHISQTKRCFGTKKYIMIHDQCEKKKNTRNKIGEKKTKNHFCAHIFVCLIF